MILGDLDLDWAEQDPDYLARVKAFLQSTAKSDISIPGHPFPLARISHTGPDRPFGRRCRRDRVCR